MKALSLSSLIIASLHVAQAGATTWSEPSPVPDPVRQGATCQVSEPMSSGSYIYQWPSKYDQVFWPLTDPAGIWFCRESGFTAFIDDFTLTNTQRAALANDLSDYKRSNRVTLRDKLALLQRCYVSRNADATTTIKVLRVLAYYNDAEFKDFDAARTLRRQALGMIEAELQTKLTEGQRLEYLFVAAAYHREFGEEEKSLAMSRTLTQALKDSKDPQLKGFVEYLTALKADIETIVPGGSLAPKED